MTNDIPKRDGHALGDDTAINATAVTDVLCNRKDELSILMVFACVGRTS